MMKKESNVRSSRFISKKALHNVFYFLLCAVICLAVLIPFIYWIRHPELTEMQVFLEWWWLYVPSLIMSILIKIRG